MFDFAEKYDEYLRYFDSCLKNRFDALNKDAPETIKQAMRYAVENGGKRVRPILCYSACEMLGKDKSAVKNLALAIEFIHSYSLVHDDLPAMDNDDFRRGRPSTHKMFGEAAGILAGDALLNFAFETMLSEENATKEYVAAMSVIAEYAGYCGMVGGQVLDLENENNPTATEKDLYAVYLNKTAKLISAPILAASIVNGGKYYVEMKEYGYNLGILFQITDDIMDACGTFEQIGKTPHKDDAENKLTAVGIFGLEGAADRAKKHYSIAKTIIEKIDGSGFLTAFTDKIYQRNK